MILEAIINHRNCESNDLNAIIYKSDKLSRACYKCKAAKGCNWPLEKKFRDKVLRFRGKVLKIRNTEFNFGERTYIMGYLMLLQIHFLMEESSMK